MSKKNLIGCYLCLTLLCPAEIVVLSLIMNSITHVCSTHCSFFSRSTSRLKYQLINQSVIQSMNQLINQSITQLNNQSFNQSLRNWLMPGLHRSILAWHCRSQQKHMHGTTNETTTPTVLKVIFKTTFKGRFLNRKIRRVKTHNFPFLPPTTQVGLYSFCVCGLKSLK